MANKRSGIYPVDKHGCFRCWDPNKKAIVSLGKDAETARFRHRVIWEEFEKEKNQPALAVKKEVVVTRDLALISNAIEKLEYQIDALISEKTFLCLERAGKHIAGTQWSYCTVCGGNLVREPRAVCFRCVSQGERH